MMQSWVQKTAENYALALGLCMVMAFIPLLNWVSLSWATLMVLRRSLAIGAISIAVIGFLMFYVVSGLRFHFNLHEVFAILSLIGPIWLMAYSLKRWGSLSLSLQAGFLCMMLIVFINFAIYGVMTPEELYQFLQNRLFAGSEPQAGSFTETMQTAYLEGMTQALVIAWPGTIFLLQASVLLFARYMQSRWYYPGGFQPAFHQLRLARVINALMLLIVLWAILQPQSQLALQLTGLVMMILLIAGIACVHWFVKFKKASVYYLMAFYLLLALLSGWVGPLLMMIAILDSQLDLRKRLENRSQS